MSHTFFVVKENQLETMEALKKQCFDELESTITNEDAPELFVLINTKNKVYWTVDAEALEEAEVLTTEKDGEKIKLTTLKQIQSWEN